MYKQTSGLIQYSNSADALKFWLMPFVCILCFGFPTAYGGMVSTMCGFAPVCFFILSGFFTLVGDVFDEAAGIDVEAELICRGLKRSFGIFIGLFIAYFSINIGYYIITGAGLSGLFRLRYLFNVVVLCAWPFQMGESISFIQSLFYAYVILWIMHRTGLMRLYKLIMLLCFALTLLSGELAGVVHFSFLGTPYLPMNALNRALPYMLLGKLMREKPGLCLAHAPKFFYICIFAGLALAFGEFSLLSSMGMLRTTGHAIGFGITAYGLTGLALSNPDEFATFFSFHGRRYSRVIYGMMQIVGFAVIVPVSIFAASFLPIVQSFGGIIVYILSLAIAAVYDAVIPLKRSMPVIETPDVQDAEEAVSPAD